MLIAILYNNTPIKKKRYDVHNQPSKHPCGSLWISGSWHLANLTCKSLNDTESEVPIASSTSLSAVPFVDAPFVKWQSLTRWICKQNWSFLATFFTKWQLSYWDILDILCNFGNFWIQLHDNPLIKSCTLIHVLMQFAMSTLISNIKFPNKQMRFPNFGQGFESHIFHGENMKCFKPTLQKT